MEIKLPDIKTLKNHPRSMIAIFIAFFILTAWLVESAGDKRAKGEEDSTSEAIDTYIPDGFVLVPIEVQNLASLDSIVGQYGVVDLYSEGEKSAVGRGLKLIRSPRDPSQFAVMVPEAASRSLVQFSQKPFQVIVQNPKQDKSEIRRADQKNRILWED